MCAGSHIATQAPPDDPHYERRRLILGILVIAQIMILLDANVVNVALALVQRVPDK